MFRTSSAATDNSGIAIASPATMASPDSSPIFSASHSDSIETRCTSLVDFGSSDEASVEHPRVQRLPDILDPATSSGIRVENLCFIGAGYVGVPTAAVVALKNPSIRVTVIDRDAFRIRRWNSSHLPLDEPGLHNIVRITRDGSKEPPRKPNLFFSTETAKCISEADMVFICVNTNTKISGIGAGFATDMTAMESAIREVAINAKSRAILVEKSTVPCRTAKLVKEIISTFRPRARLEVLSNPEFLSEGTAVKNLLYPDRILIGSSSTASGHRAAAALANIYAAWVSRDRICGTNVYASELSKLVANAMLAQRISSINSISAICEQTGVDIKEVSKAIGLDPRIGPQFLKAGLGFGGSCFRKDIGSLVYLARSLGLDEVGDYWNQVLVINEMQRSRFSKKVIQRLNGTLVGKKITLLGFAFKKDTGDTRESLALDVTRVLLEERPGEIAIFDPGCHPEAIWNELGRHIDLTQHGERIKIYTDPYQASEKSNAIIIVTEWDCFSLPASRPMAINFKATKASATTSTFTVPVESCDRMSPSKTPLVESEYFVEPPCPENCPDCRIAASSSPAYNMSGPLEWARIAYNMEKPKLVFDGRGVVNPTEMEKLGFVLETIGRGESERR